MKAKAGALLGAAILLGVFYNLMNPDHNLVADGLDPYVGCYQASPPHDDLRFAISADGNIAVGGRSVAATVRKSNGKPFLSVRDGNGFVVNDGTFHFTGTDREYLLRDGTDNLSIPNNGLDAVVFTKTPCQSP